MKQLDGKSFEKLYRRMDQLPQVRERWSLLYSVSRPESGNITNQSFWPLHCASGHSDLNEYQACLSSHR